MDGVFGCHIASSLMSLLKPEAGGLCDLPLAEPLHSVLWFISTSLWGVVLSVSGSHLRQPKIPLCTWWGWIFVFRHNRGFLQSWIRQESNESPMLKYLSIKRGAWMFWLLQKRRNLQTWICGFYAMACLSRKFLWGFLMASSVKFLNSLVFGFHQCLFTE